MKNKRIYIILNPVAGAGRGKKAMNFLLSAISDLGRNDCVLLETQGPGDATRLAREVAEKGGTLLIAVGGDGTINEVINGLLPARISPAGPCELGIVNCGSGAGVAQTLGIPAGIKEQVQLIFNKPARALDAGLLTCRDKNGAAAGRYFLNECQAGFSGAVVKEVGMAQKRFGGRLAFGMVSISQLFRYKATQMQVRVDMRPAVAQKMLGVVIGNGNYCAGGMQLTPGARPGDGYLDVLLMGEMNLPDRLTSFSRVYSGNHVHARAFSLQKARTIEIDSEAPVWVETDGELIGRTPCRIDIVPGAVWVRY